ncbi:CoA transferase [Sediminicoccus sp. KRV36]|uniref:CoA transferase n=1 Tax=Sediminicoccus sp. KRV36 TaxID=3133721 RepID=UPI00200E0EA4|nr:CoA transferase [Sediminicoccus rosea]UPY39154.1 CoA transferase [Sediminicoccus rosea]
MTTLARLLAGAGLDPALATQADLTGTDPTLPSSFRIGEAAQASIAALGLAAASLHAARGGPMQRVAVSMDDAAAEFHSERYMRIGDTPPRDPWDAIAGAYPTRDGVVRLHTNFPHHRDGILALLGCANDRAAVAAALSQREAVAFETEATAAGLCVSAMRSFAEWDAHPQAQHLATTPLLAIERIGDAPPRPLPALASRPLEGFRVLDLTRVIAGPVAARGLAAHGAEVLHITSPHLPSIPTLVVDTGRGKSCAFLDLNDAADAARLDALAAGADAFVQSYRAGALAAKGFSAEALAARHPGIVVGELCAYGWGGPWANKRGFDSLVQTSTGFNVAEAEAAGAAPPKVLPCQPLDHASGYLLALGVVAAWQRRAAEGGSWRVRVTLARTGIWLRGLGRIADGFAGVAPHTPSLVTEEGAFGMVRHVPHAARMSVTPARWARPAEPLGASPAAWM